MGSLLIQEKQESPPTKPTKPHLKSNQTHLSDPKNLYFFKWVSNNSLKIFAFTLIALTVAAVFLLFNAGDPAALLCFRNQKPLKNQQKIQIPEINHNSITPIVDKSSPFASFRSRRWVVVSVSDYPTDALKSLVKMKGWQVLAVGNSRTPNDWELKGVIFLSMERQAELGFRVVDYLPYDSYVRKSVGYLFAIQHGAKVIFDADDRGEVIGGDLGKVFDLDLKGAVANQQKVLQYTNVVNANRTVVNPYIHFGQRSVWPRGLPLENVGEVEHEEFYNEVNGGMQYIQQGISNGLPDVDSVFYSTRKSGEETFDINFDEHAPKVSLPQGIMVPMNSFNSMFHYNAFWALMLPVSVSTMASDVLRGYWGQRLLWEIGGNAMVYPPTMHRPDKTEAYPFSEEKDLHVNVGRLVKFLVSWRSSKQNLSEKMLELSYLMAEKEFWTEIDVKFTSAWIQDLIAVGYLEPKLMALDLDRQSTSVGDADRREFIPRKLPSVHLGVEESGTVNYEIGNLIRWRRNFGNIVLILFVSGPVERTALEWKLLYGRIFKTVVILSMQADDDLAIEQSQLDQVYKYLPRLFNRFPDAEGFMFLQDDTVLNYWNLVQADKTKLWTTNKVPGSWTTVSTAGNSSSWFSQQGRMVRKVVSTMPVHFQVNYKEGGPGKKTLTLSDSEVFYIPRPFVSDFIDLVGLVGDLEIHHKVAIPMFFLSMDSPRNFDPVFNKIIYETEAKSSDPLVLYSAQVPAVHPWSVSSEPEFIKLIRLMAIGDPLLMELF